MMRNNGYILPLITGILVVTPTGCMVDDDLSASDSADITGTDLDRDPAAPDFSAPL